MEQAEARLVLKTAGTTTGIPKRTHHCITQQVATGIEAHRQHDNATAFLVHTQKGMYRVSGQKPSFVQICTAA